MADGENSVLYIKHYELTVASFYKFDYYIQYERGFCFPYEIHTEIFVEAKSRWLQRTLKQGDWEKNGGRRIEKREREGESEKREWEYILSKYDKMLMPGE